MLNYVILKKIKLKAYKYMAIFKKIGTIIIGVLLSIKALAIKVYAKLISNSLLACDYIIVGP